MNDARHDGWDPITFELVRHALEHLGDEMARTIGRCAYSPLIRTSNDYATAVLDRDCEVVAQGHTSPVHLSSIRDAARGILARFPEVRPGDVYVINDPYTGGSHLPDIFVIMPVFHELRLFGYVGSEAHHCDVGGRSPGSNAADCVEIFQEGLRIPPLLLAKDGKLVAPVVELIRANCRLPERLFGDLHAQIAALHVGEEQLLALIERYGWDDVNRYAAGALDYAERLARAEIETWPDGRYEFEDYLDGIDAESGPVCIRAAVTIAGGEVEVSFEGTDPQLAAGINSPGHFTAAAAAAAVRCALRADIPYNTGFLRALTVTVPPGSVLNPVAPAPVAGRSVSALRAFDAVLGCLARAVPDKVMAAAAGTCAMVTLTTPGTRGAREIVSEVHSARGAPAPSWTRSTGCARRS